MENLDGHVISHDYITRDKGAPTPQAVQLRKLRYVIGVRRPVLLEGTDLRIMARTNTSTLIDTLQI